MSNSLFLIFEKRAKITGDLDGGFRLDCDEELSEIAKKLNVRPILSFCRYPLIEAIRNRVKSTVIVKSDLRGFTKNS